MTTTPAGGTPAPPVTGHKAPGHSVPKAPEAAFDDVLDAGTDTRPASGGDTQKDALSPPEQHVAMPFAMFPINHGRSIPSTEPSDRLLLHGMSGVSPAGNPPGAELRHDVGDLIRRMETIGNTGRHVRTPHVDAGDLRMALQDRPLPMPVLADVGRIAEAKWASLGPTLPLANGSLPSAPNTQLPILGVAAPDAGIPATQLPDVLVTAAHASRSRTAMVRIVLNPAGLGSIDATLRFDGERLAVRLAFDRQATAELIAPDIDRIRTAFAHGGYQSPEVVLLPPETGDAASRGMAGMRDGQGAGRHDANPGPSIDPPGQLSEQAAVTAPAEPPSPSRRMI